MGEAAEKDQGQKKDWFKGLRSEFKKIIWPDQKSIVRQTIAVVTISVILAGIIKVVDMIIQNGFNFVT